MFFQKYKHYVPVFQIFGIISGVGLLFTFFHYQTYLNLLGFLEKEEEKTSEQLFLEKEKKQFGGLFESDVNFEKWNANIASVFYDKTQYEDAIKEKENSLEKKWKSRILMEHTPRGNVIMYYDPYKHGFAYYSDMHIPYEYLNACAMKYVRLYLCRDFFIDQSYYPANLNSPFMRIHEIEKKKPSENRGKFDVRKGPFAKIKKNTGSTVKESKQEKKEEEKKPDYIKNKFIHLGKIYNFSFLNKEMKVVSKKRDLGEVNYGSFKKWRNMKPSEDKEDELKNYFSVGGGLPAVGGC